MLERESTFRVIDLGRRESEVSDESVYGFDSVMLEGVCDVGEAIEGASEKLAFEFFL